MEIVPAFHVKEAEGERPGAFASFPYDRELVQRFREAFPRARWRTDEECWFVPGTTAVARLNVWISQELDALDRHADAKGRDAFQFEPLESPYLHVGDDLQVRTPYAQAIVEAIRQIPWARWDPDERIWRVPFRSYEGLKARWPEIEEAARYNEPEARRRRQQERKAAGAEPARDPLAADRRQRRYPVPGDDLPPMDEPVAAGPFGVVVFEDVETTPLGAEEAARYPHIGNPAGYVWARWRMPTVREAYRARPIREADDAALSATRGWRLPTAEDLKERLRRLRAVERARRSRGDVSEGGSAAP
ncbi:MAG TPA: hypothetical protein VIL09_03445 [Microvirga sp.]|jgi:hypothetical protein